MNSKLKNIWIVTLFPQFIEAFLDIGVIGKALRGERGETQFKLNIIKLSDYSPKDFKGVDDSPYGGGHGLVMRADVLKNAIAIGVLGHNARDEEIRDKLFVIYTSARGTVWSNQVAIEFSKKFIVEDEGRDLVFICGRYEGVDERFIEKYVDLEISVGDYILSGGELAVLSILDSALRFVPGVLGNNNSLADSFSSQNSGELEAPIYTKPQVFEGMEVPAVLLSGNHKDIVEWKDNQRRVITRKYRPDLLQGKK